MTNIQIEPNYKFKTASVGCFLRLPLNQKNLALANVLCVMQSNASLLYPGVSLQAKALEEKYDSQLEIFPQVFGNQIIIFYSLNFIEPREILNPDYNYAEIIKMFLGIIKKPLFNPSLLYLAKSQLSSVRAQYLDIPSNYALNRFFEYWYRNESQYKDNMFGDMEVIKNCTIEQIKSFFDNLKTYPAVCLGLVENPDMMTDLLQEQLDWPGFFRSFDTDELTIPAHFAPFTKNEEGEHGQTQLLMGFGYDASLPLDLRQFGGLILSQYLAGDESSKLFTSIREDLGAAYAIEVNNLLDDSLLLISAGIDKDKLLATKAKINQSIRDVAKGNIDKILFKRAQNALKRTYQSNEDQESLLLMQLLANTLRGRSLTIEERIKKVVNFTPEKLTRFAQSLFLNESYCLQ